MKGSLGIMARIAKTLECDYTTVYNYFKRYPSLEKSRLLERENGIDIAENTLFKNASEGDTGACIWITKTLGKHRGWVERTESIISGSMHVGGKIELTQEQEKKLTEEAFASVISRRNVLADAN